MAVEAANYAENRMPPAEVLRQRPVTPREAVGFFEGLQRTMAQQSDALQRLQITDAGQLMDCLMANDTERIVFRERMLAGLLRGMSIPGFRMTNGQPTGRTTPEIRQAFFDRVIAYTLIYSKGEEWGEKNWQAYNHVFDIRRAIERSLINNKITDIQANRRATTLIINSNPLAAEKCLQSWIEHLGLEDKLEQTKRERGLSAEPDLAPRSEPRPEPVSAPRGRGLLDGLNEGLTRYVEHGLPGRIIGAIENFIDSDTVARTMDQWLDRIDSWADKRIAERAADGDSEEKLASGEALSVLLEARLAKVRGEFVREPQPAVNRLAWVQKKLTTTFLPAAFGALPGFLYGWGVEVMGGASLAGLAAKPAVAGLSTVITNMSACLFGGGPRALYERYSQGAPTEKTGRLGKVLASWSAMERLLVTGGEIKIGGRVIDQVRGMGVEEREREIKDMLSYGTGNDFYAKAGSNKQEADRFLRRALKTFLAQEAISDFKAKGLTQTDIQARRKFFGELFEIFCLKYETVPEASSADLMNSAMRAVEELNQLRWEMTLEMLRSTLVPIAALGGYAGLKSIALFWGGWLAGKETQEAKKASAGVLKFLSEQAEEAKKRINEALQSFSPSGELPKVEATATLKVARPSKTATKVLSKTATPEATPTARPSATPSATSTETLKSQEPAGLPGTRTPRPTKPVEILPTPTQESYTAPLKHGLASPVLAPETAGGIRAYQFAIPKGSNAGEQVEKALKLFGASSEHKLWGSLAAYDIWLDQDMLDMNAKGMKLAWQTAQKLKDQETLGLFNSLGFDLTSGQFDLDKIEELKRLTQSSDPETAKAAIKKAYLIWRWRQAEKIITIPETILTNG